MAPKANERGVQLAFRVPADLVQRLDAHAERLSRDNPGLEFTRTDAVRTLLTRALDEIEAGAKRRKS
jgi:predicted DNA-binding protein